MKFLVEGDGIIVMRDDKFYFIYVNSLISDPEGQEDHIEFTVKK